jgi:hypothetical protein
MRYSLRTLLILAILGPPMLAGAWFAAVWWYNYRPSTSLMLVICSCVLLLLLLANVAIGAAFKRRMTAVYFRLKKEDAERRARMKDESTPSNT